MSLGHDRVRYDRVLLMDINPGPNYPHVTAVSFEKTGIPVRLLESIKMTREIRLQPRDLPIYPDPGHEYYLIAKLERDVTRAEELRAVGAVNSFIAEFQKAGISLKDVVRQIVDNFKGRVQRLVPYVRKSERGDHRPVKSSFRKRPAVSSSDLEVSASEATGLKTGLDLSKALKAAAERKRTAVKVRILYVVRVMHYVYSFILSFMDRHGTPRKLQTANRVLTLPPPLLAPRHPVKQNRLATTNTKTTPKPLISILLWTRVETCSRPPVHPRLPAANL